jgi:hypothetical protein
MLQESLYFLELAHPQGTENLISYAIVLEGPANKGLQNYKITKLQNYKITKLCYYNITKLLCSQKLTCFSPLFGSLYMFFTVHFEAAFGAVVRRHAQAFASHFVLKDDKLFLRVTNEPFAFTEFHDWSGYADKEERVKRFAFSIIFQDFFVFSSPFFFAVIFF